MQEKEEEETAKQIPIIDLQPYIQNGCDTSSTAHQIR
jgi:hypothetical protein